MSNPQLEDGYTKIANELIEALFRIRLSGREYAIILCVIRKTYGFNKKEDWISYGKFEKFTGLTRSCVYRAIEGLVAKKLLVADKQLGQTIYSLNKRYLEWVVADKQLVADKLQGSCQSATQVVAYKQPTKETITKETIQKKRDVTTDADKMSAKKMLVALINQNQSFALLSNQSRESKVNSWAKDIEKLRRIDCMPTDKIDSVIEWLYSSTHKDAVFWRRNILSGNKLREHFARLIGSMESEPKKSFTRYFNPQIDGEPNN